MQLRGGNAVSIQHFVRNENTVRSTLVMTYVEAVCKRHILDVPVRNISQQVLVFGGRHQLESQLFLVFGCVELRHQILIAGRTHTGAAGCVTAALAFLLLFRLNDFSEIVAVFLPENAGNFAGFPEKAAAAGLGLVAVILDSIDQNDVRFDVFCTLVASIQMIFG